MALHTPSSSTNPLARAAITACTITGRKAARPGNCTMPVSLARSFSPSTNPASRLPRAAAPMRSSAITARGVSIITHNATFPSKPAMSIAAERAATSCASSTFGASSASMGALAIAARSSAPHAVVRALIRPISLR